MTARARRALVRCTFEPTTAKATTEHGDQPMRLLIPCISHVMNGQPIRSNNLLEPKTLPQEMLQLLDVLNVCVTIEEAIGRTRSDALERGNAHNDDGAHVVAQYPLNAVNQTLPRGAADPPTRADLQANVIEPAQQISANKLALTVGVPPGDVNEDCLTNLGGQVLHLLHRRHKGGENRVQQHNIAHHVLFANIVNQNVGHPSNANLPLAIVNAICEHTAMNQRYTRPPALQHQRRKGQDTGPRTSCWGSCQMHFRGRW